MKTIEVSVKLLTDEAAVAKSVELQVETFRVANRRWLQLAKGKTKADGTLTLKFAPKDRNLACAPMLRLVEAGKRGTRILAQGGFTSYDNRAQILYVDFGVVEKLEETAYKLTAASSRFARTTHTVSGAEKRGEISNAQMVRAIAKGNPSVVGPVTSEAKVTAKSDAAWNKVFSGKELTSQTTGNITLTEKRPLVTNVGTKNVGTKNTGGTRLSNTNLGEVKDIQSFQNELVRFSSREVELVTEVEKEKARAVTLETQLSAEKSQVTNLKSELSQVKTQKAKLTLENQALKTSVTKEMPIQDVASNMASEIHLANDKLKNLNHSYRLGKVNVTLRGVVGGEGKTVSLAHITDKKEGEGQGVYQDINFDLHPGQASAQEGASVKVPDVSGLTQSVVRRLLTAVGLQLDISHRSVGDSSELPIGQSILQSPKINTAVPRGSKVRVVFAAR